MKNKKKSICIVTGSRADYDLLRNLIIQLKQSKKFKLSLIVTGQHISRDYGNTSKKIYEDFGKICHSINTNVKETNSTTILNSISLGINKIGKYLKLKKPDLIILLGDRYEILSAGIGSIFNNVKIAHIHGGEVTSGSIDDIIRHAITKFSDFHFVSTNSYKKRVIQMGESPKNIFNVGALGVENIKKIKLINKEKLEKKLSIKFNKFNFLITINSFIEEKVSINDFLKNFFLAIKKFKDTSFIFTLPNSDLKSDYIRNKILDFCKKNKNSYTFKSLGAQKYLSCMKICDVVLGNSSSGILEAPTLKVATVNIGDRQKGRLQANSIINSDYSFKKIYDSINKSLSLNFKKKIKKTQNPYYKKNTAMNIVNIIEKKIFKKKIKLKKFYDI
ncbi:UDP-N-acetylglucosamine 2-epimerase [Candidatus Pelagibacter sp.]|nr:UDP-N-acetylglucosamine 2-epimerase [Candidatus Pelagibacter sp.]